ncbi:MAG: GyrI-like domain-containing protein, partial [Clostridia bacterium]|nr:GyrI-like domain-containing protein [Clostridia bacterium]
LGYLEEISLTVYPFGDLQPPKCWNLYNTQRRSAKLSGGRVVEDHGVMYFHKDTGRLDYFIGIPTEKAAGDREGTEELRFPGGLYAIFETPPATQHEFSAVIRDTWDYIREEWFPKSGYLRKDGYELEKYTEASRTYTETIYIPIERKKEHG